MRSRLALTLLAAMLVPAPTAHAQSTLTSAADQLRESPVYVDQDAERALSGAETARLRRLISKEGAGPMYVVVLPASATDEAGGDPSAALRDIAQDLGEPGTYAGVIGDSFRAGSVGVDVPASELARQSLEDHASGGTMAVLEDFVKRVGDARSGSGSGGSSGGGGGFPLVLLALIAVPLVLFGLGRRRQRRAAEERARAELEEVTEVAREDLIALGDDVRALDLDVEMPNTSARAKAHYDQAVQCYSTAEQRLDAVRHADDVERVTSALEEGRWAMEAAKAELAGREPPERRAPCFFDPRHGPSVADVDWAPPGGQPRAVPVCAADLQRIEDGIEPESRYVPVGGQMVPYWAAGPAYMPWAGGFFGGGLLPGLFVGSMLGGGFFGGGWGDGVYAGDGFGGGDFGGADLGDFGGGDFGDFGGGGDF